MVRHHWIGLFVCLTLVSCHQEKSNQIQKEAGSGILCEFQQGMGYPSSGRDGRLLLAAFLQL